MDLFKGTLLEELLEIELFIDPGYRIEPGEKIIGEMTDLEKAVYTLIELRQKKIRNIMEKGEEPVFSNRKLTPVEALDKVRKEVETLDQLLWALIEDRLRVWENEVGIREKYKIVLIPPKDKTQPPDLSDFLKFILTGKR